MDKAFILNGLMVAAGAVILTTLRGIPVKFYQWFMKRITIHVEFPDNSTSFYWVDSWLTTQKFIGGHRNIGIRVINTDDSQSNIEFVTAPGRHYCFYKKRLVIINRYRKEFENFSWAKPYYENISVSFLFGNPQIVKSFVEDARKSYEVDEKQISIFTTEEAKTWRMPQKRMVRPIDSIILDYGIKESILTDINTFKKSKAWYAQYGIPYRRGYLLYGPPGNGKTSIIKSIAAKYKQSISVLTLNQKDMDDSKLQGLIDSFPQKSILLLEDIDCLFKERKEGDVGVTLSGLLNAIDGASSREDYLLFMTTNHIEKLDPALVREGRVDKKIYIGNPNSDQAGTFFKRFLDNHQLANNFGQLIAEQDKSMAFVQEHLLGYRDDPEKAILSLQKE